LARLFLLTWNGRSRIADANLFNQLNVRLVANEIAYMLASTAIPHRWAMVSIVLMSSTKRDLHREQ
jgi:hypothetical protein